MTEETTPPIEVNEEPTNAPTIPEPIEKLKKPSKKRVRETPPPKIKKVYNDRYKMGLLAEKLVEKIKPELKPDVKAEVKAEPLPLPEQMKITIKESPIQCPKDDEDIKQFPTGKIFDKYDDTRLVKLVSLGDCSNEVIHAIPGASLGDFSILDFDKLDFNLLTINPNAGTFFVQLDYERMMTRFQPIAKEISEYVFKPDRMCRMSQAVEMDLADYLEFY